MGDDGISFRGAFCYTVHALSDKSLMKALIFHDMAALHSSTT